MGVGPAAVTRLAGHAAAISHFSSFVGMRTAATPRTELIDSAAKFVQLAEVIFLIPIRHAASAARTGYSTGLFLLRHAIAQGG